MTPTLQPVSLDQQLAALATTAGAYLLPAAGWLRITGSDRHRWLAGMTTNAVQQLSPGAGCYNFILSAQGRIQGDANIYLADVSSLLLQTSAAQLAPLTALLDHFIIMDDVELADVSSTLHGIAISGPHSSQLLASLDFDAATLAPIALREFTRNGVTGLLIAAYSPLAPAFELWLPTPDAAASLLAELTSAGATSCSPEAVEAHRILSGIPRYGTDIRDRDLPQETAQMRALSFTKGCYIGQEIVERIRSRGAVHRTFTGFELTGPIPHLPAALELDGKPAGELTSAAIIGPRTLALGYIRVDAQAQKRALTYSSGTAMPAALPFTHATAPLAAASNDQRP